MVWTEPIPVLTRSLRAALKPKPGTNLQSTAISWWLAQRPVHCRWDLALRGQHHRPKSRRRKRPKRTA